MTHLTAEVQAAWIKELARCLKPNGLLLLTYCGDSGVAYTSLFRSPEWWEKWLVTNFNDDQHDPALDTQIADKSYYRLTIQNEKDVRARWGGYFEIVKIVPEAFGNQDLAIMRKR